MLETIDEEGVVEIQLSDSEITRASQTVHHLNNDHMLFSKPAYPVVGQIQSDVAQVELACCCIAELLAVRAFLVCTPLEVSTSAGPTTSEWRLRSNVALPK